MAYDVTDRRPIAARSLSVVHVAASRLAAWGVSPNMISLLGLFLALVAGGCFVATAGLNAVEDSWPVRGLWLVGALGVQGRLMCNLLDGMVAVQRGVASARGELFNEVPDRFADLAVLVGLGYAAGGWATAGWAAGVAAVLTAYMRAVGRGLQQESDFSGPMAKPQRMFTVTCCALAATAMPGWARDHDFAGWTLVLITAGSVFTFARRLHHIQTQLRTNAQTTQDLTPS